MVPELGTELTRPLMSAPFRNPRKPASLRSTVCRILADVFFQEERQRFFLPPEEAEYVRGPPDWISIALGQRQAVVADPLSFLVQWFSNRQVSSVFRPSPTHRIPDRDLTSHRIRVRFTPGLGHEQSSSATHSFRASGAPVT
jgi:hypothetical protein